MNHDRFQGRYASGGRQCEWHGCGGPGEFRAPGDSASSFDGPGHYRWFCLDHVRQFNSGYDFFAGMSSEEVSRAQSPVYGWQTESRAFSAAAGIDLPPRWADFADPLEAIGERARLRGSNGRGSAGAGPTGRKDGRPVTGEERRALDVLGLPLDADRKALRTRYSDLVRKYHPDRNGGDRSMEARLGQVVEAYQLLRKSSVFA